MNTLLAAQLVLIPVHAVEIWIYWSWPRTGRHRGGDLAVILVALVAWIMAAAVSSRVVGDESPIWPVIVGSTSGYLAFTACLLIAWIVHYGRRS